MICIGMPRSSSWFVCHCPLFGSLSYFFLTFKFAYVSNITFRAQTPPSVWRVIVAGPAIETRIILTNAGVCKIDMRRMQNMSFATK